MNQPFITALMLAAVFISSPVQARSVLSDTPVRVGTEPMRGAGNDDSGTGSNYSGSGRDDRVYDVDTTKPVEVRDGTANDGSIPPAAQPVQPKPNRPVPHSVEHPYGLRKGQ